MGVFSWRRKTPHLSDGEAVAKMNIRLCGASREKQIPPLRYGMTNKEVIAGVYLLRVGFWLLPGG